MSQSNQPNQQTPKPWTKDHELAYWNAESDDYYLSNIRQKYEFFDVNEFIKQRFGLRKNSKKLTAVDIGGGAYGGALRYGRIYKQAILVDALAPEFRAMRQIPKYVDSITADFDSIPLKDEIADVLFAWNVFDHAKSDIHFIIGMLEAKRLLKPGGLFFGSFPLRTKPSPGHPVTLTERLVMRQLTREQHNIEHNHEPRQRHNHEHNQQFDILKTFKVHEPYYRDETLFVVAEKSRQ